jgi:histidyl-tRNA synthetase
VRYQTVRGTRDILPGEVEAWQRAETLAREIFRRYGFREIRTPIFESTELFARGVGGSTDIVRKEMFSFISGDDALTLRPEMTASVVRAYIQHGLSRVPGAERLYYIGPMFRHERPQKGRQRQFHQIGAEVFGADDPYVDAETIEMVMSFLALAASIAPAAPSGGASTTVVSSRFEIALVVNSVGDATCRPSYREALHAWLEETGPGASGRRRERLCEDCQRRLVENPLRVFDCKVPADRELLSAAPAMLDHLCDPCRAHFDAFLGHLKALGIDHRIDKRLVRGLDYYVRTAFEIVAERGLGSQNSLMGGGRYDGLVKELGGPDVAGFGWALGIERLMMLLGLDPSAAAAGALSASAVHADVYLAHVGERADALGPPLARDLRARGLSVRFDPRPAKLGAQLGRAAKAGARFALILGDDEIDRATYPLKDLLGGTQEAIAAGSPVQLAARVAERIEGPLSGSRER